MTVGTVLLRPISFTAAWGRQVCSARAMGTKAASKVNLAAVIQLTCTADKAANYSRASSLVSEAASRGAEVAFLPEAFDFIGENRQQVRELSEPLDGPTVTAYRDLAKFHGISLSLGGLHESCGDSEEKIRNTHLLIDSFGNILTTYTKVHLFDVEIPGKFRLRESDHASPGNRIEPPARLPYSDLSIGLGICYDLRFPELAASLARRGADVLTFPSAFTVATGLAHWETLLRARAIETQCYVVAAAQTGKHNDKRSSYGHSVIVDPWGTVVAQCAEGEYIFPSF
jgi:predicted amidohydrolase